MNVTELIERLRFGDSTGDDHDDAAAALEAQAREIERLRGGFEGACYCCEPVAVVNIELSRRLAAAERDAERYRYLRLHRPRVWELMPAEVLDAAIDAAREGK